MRVKLLLVAVAFLAIIAAGVSQLSRHQIATDRQAAAMTSDPKKLQYDNKGF